MEEKQKKRNSYGEEFFHNVTKRLKEIGLFERKQITSGEVLGVIADLAGEDYRPTSGSYILTRWSETVSKILRRERRVVFSSDAGRNVSMIVFIPINEEERLQVVQPARGNEEKSLLIQNVVTVLDRQSTARNNEIYVPNLRELWVGDEENSGIALLCKASKVLRSTFGFGFTYNYNKFKKVVRIQDSERLRRRLLDLMPVHKEKVAEGEESTSVKFNQFVRLTDQAADAIYMIGVALNQNNNRGIEIYSLAKFLSEAQSLVQKNMTTADIKTLVKSVASEYFTISNGSNIISLTVGGWEKIQKKFDPKDRLIEILILVKDNEIVKDNDNITVLNEQIGLGSLLTDCSWESFKKLGRLVYTGKVELPTNKKLEEKLIKDVEDDLIKIQSLSSPLFR